MRDGLTTALYWDDVNVQAPTTDPAHTPVKRPEFVPLVASVHRLVNVHPATVLPSTDITEDS